MTTDETHRDPMRNRHTQVDYSERILLTPSKQQGRLQA